MVWVRDWFLKEHRSEKYWYVEQIFHPVVEWITGEECLYSSKKTVILVIQQGQVEEVLGNNY